MQGLCSMVNFLWDADKDGFVTYAIETPKFFAICTIYYLYLDWVRTPICDEFKNTYLLK